MIFRLCQINLFTSKLYQSNNNIWLSLYYMHVVVLYSIFFLGENDWVCFLLPLVKCGKIIVVDRFSVKKGEFSRTKKTAYSTTTNTMIWNHKNCLVLSRPLTFQQNKIKFFVLPWIVRRENLSCRIYWRANVLQHILPLLKGVCRALLPPPWNEYLFTAFFSLYRPH